MKGTYFLGNKTFEVREMSFPEPGPNEVLIRNRVCGVCGTDVHIYHGEAGSADVTPPVVLGHEYAGVVEKVGENVTVVKPGDCVAVDPNIYCGTCRYCRKGHKQLCDSMKAVGVTRDGGFAEYSLVPDTQVFLMKKEVGFDAMAMVEPLACCVHGIEQIQIQAGDLVVVVGGGAIGLLMVQLAKIKGAGTVVLSEPVEKRREIGKQVGADFTMDPIKEDVHERLLAMTGRNGADVIIECVGNVKATAQAVSLADKGARVLLFSVPKVDAKYELPLFDVYKKELKIYGSFVNPDSHQEAVDLLNAGVIKTAPIITHHFRLDQLEEAIFMQMSDDSIKVQVEAEVSKG